MTRRRQRASLRWLADAVGFVALMAALVAVWSLYALLTGGK